MTKSTHLENNIACLRCQAWDRRSLLVLCEISTPLSTTQNHNNKLPLRSHLRNKHFVQFHRLDNSLCS